MSSQQFLVLLPPSHRREVAEDRLAHLVRQRLGTAGLPAAQNFINELRRASPVQLPFSLASKQSNVELSMSLLMELARTFVTDRAVHDPRIEVVEHEDSLGPRMNFHGERSPRVGTVYVRHPHDRNLLLRMSEFHSYLLAEKREEFEVLVAKLGGRSIRLEERDGRANDAFAGARVAGVDAAQFGADVSNETNSRFELTASFGRPKGAPHIPDGLRWLPVEPDWRAMATNRLEGRELLSRTVEFRYSTDFSVTSGLAVQFEGIGLDIGGSFESAKKIERRCTVEFWPNAD